MKNPYNITKFIIGQIAIWTNVYIVYKYHTRLPIIIILCIPIIYTLNPKEDETASK